MKTLFGLLLLSLSLPSGAWGPSLEGRVENTLSSQSTAYTSAIVSGTGSAQSWASSNSHGRVTSELRGGRGTALGRSGSWTGVVVNAANISTGSGRGQAYADGLSMGESMTHGDVPFSMGYGPTVGTVTGNISVDTSAWTKDEATVHAGKNQNYKAKAMSDASSYSKGAVSLSGMNPGRLFRDVKNAWTRGTSKSHVAATGRRAWARGQAGHSGSSEIWINTYD